MKTPSTHVIHVIHKRVFPNNGNVEITGKTIARWIHVECFMKASNYGHEEIFNPTFIAEEMSAIEN